MKITKITSAICLLAVAAIMSICSISYPVTVTANKSVKEGTVSQKVIFGFRPMNMDLSIKTAAENGGIKRVATVDFIVENKALGFIQKYTTLVTGE